MQEPGRDCALCPRLAEFRAANRASFADWHNAPVPAFGGLDARLLIVGLAPGLRGANRTGRPFTGDYAGDLLYPTLVKFDFAAGTFAARPDDGLELADCRITNAVRCVPPANKPVGAEIRACRAFLAAEIAAMENLTAILTLGKIAHDSVVRTLGLPRRARPAPGAALGRDRRRRDRRRGRAQPARGGLGCAHRPDHRAELHTLAADAPGVRRARCRTQSRHRPPASQRAPLTNRTTRSREPCESQY